MGAVDGDAGGPQHDAQKANRAQDRAQDQAAHQLAAQDAGPVVVLKLTQGQRADDQRRRLRARVTAAADDERDKQRQHHRARDLGFKVAHGRRGKHLADEQHQQPARALFDHVHKRTVHIRRFQGLHTAELLDVLGRFFLGNVEHVVDGDNPQQHPARIGHRQRHAVVLLEGGDDFFAVCRGQHAVQLTVVHVLDFGRRIGQYQSRQLEVV